MTLEELVGQRIVIGVPGFKATTEIVRHFKEIQAGGLILYRINFESPRQVRKMISDIEDALGRRLLVTVDHEGGRVTMFRDAVTIFPDSLALGTTKNVEYARRQGAIEARELRRLGIDVNLSPVLDVLTNAYSPNIGIRSYGKDWRLVANMGAARIAAMQKGGISACAKHYPGKGHASVDAHLSLPVILSTWKEMEDLHLRPFARAIATGVDLVMSSHPKYPKLDPRPGMIATFSRKIVHETLREKMGFKGVISSDDLEMGAVQKLCLIGEAAVRATAAGHDLILVCHSLAAQKEVYQALLDAYRGKRLSVKDLEESVERIETLKAKRSRRFEGGSPHKEKSGDKLVERISRESTTVFGNHLPFSPKRLRGKKCAVIFPRLSSLADKMMIEKPTIPEEKFIARSFGKFGIRPKVLVVDLDPTPREVERASRLARESDTTFLFCWDAHLLPSNKTLLDSVQESSRDTTVVLLRDPYDVDFVREGVSCLTDFGFRVCQLTASIQKIFS